MILIQPFLAKDPFLDASHYWPLETSHSILTTDIVSGHNAILMGGAKIKDNQEFVTTEKRGSYIIAGDFKGEQSYIYDLFI